MGLGISSLYVIYFNLLFVYYACIIFMIGIHTTRKITLEVLSTKLCEFLEFIPRTHFRQLQRLHYKSLFVFVRIRRSRGFELRQQASEDQDVLLYSFWTAYLQSATLTMKCRFVFSTSTNVMVLFSFGR